MEPTPRQPSTADSDVNVDSSTPEPELAARERPDSCYSKARTIVIRNLLSPDALSQLTECAESWPHMCELAEIHGGPCSGMLCGDLEGQAHDLAFTEAGDLAFTDEDGEASDLAFTDARHIMMYLHRGTKRRFI